MPGALAQTRGDHVVIAAQIYEAPVCRYLQLIAIGLLSLAEKARHRDARIMLFTTDATSPLAELADYQIVIPAPSLTTFQQTRDLASMQPLGTLFEQSLLTVCDSIIMELMQKNGIDTAPMLARHANLE